jgi:hypothetical protein
MNLLILETLSRIYENPMPEWRLRRRIIDAFRDDLNLSFDESVMVINHLLGEEYLSAVTIHYRCDDNSIRRENGYTASDKLFQKVIPQGLYQRLRYTGAGF